MKPGLTNAIHALQRDLVEHHPDDAVRLLERESPTDVAEMLARQPITTALPVWERLSPDICIRAIEALPETQALEILRHMDPSRVAAILAMRDQEARDRYLDMLPPTEAEELRALLSYPTDSAGALMDPRVLLLRSDTTVREALARIRALRRRGTRRLFVVDADNRLEGQVDIQDLATATTTTRLEEIQRPVRAVVSALAPREEVVEILEQYRLTDLPVVDAEERLIGAVRYRNLMAAAEDEATVAMQTMVGVSKDERALSPVPFAVRKRLPWLHINLATAFLAAAVVGLFENTIAQFTALAVLLPVVAGQSGNTGAQALAVTMRGLALREIRTRHWPRVIFKEMSAGFWNGVAIAATTALGVWIWSGSEGLAGIIAVSMILSMVIAGIFGAAIPLLLTAAGQDPAQSSSIVLTTITDVTGFFSFLGIAALFSNLL
ncbi:MAG: magnesium transporter [Gammaproteobacteria bacterium]|nr:magnesium transporter [Gammaproteobacteria bacterium]MCP5317880.1 magnesium transporter [Chromatiaceae bacterium]MCB1817912.1 magnesium transporter [Gammaproteobacteria bacterium]MCP5429108.1 magnesium transporter [Chromatiaceae bacterium]MCP5434648.1 magnesium transporter [Chromatiaceae bacterium]